VNTYVPMLKAKGVEVVYTNHIDAANPDLKPELLRMQAAGAQVIMPWSVNAGFLSRICNTRGNMGWDVPIVGQTTLGSGQTKALLEKPEYWNKVYSNNFRKCCYVNGKLLPKTEEYLQRLKAAKIDFADTLLWWVAMGWDAAHVMADTFTNAGTKNEDIVAYMNKIKDWPGVYGTVTWTPEQHNGFPDSEVVMCEVNSLKDGAFNIAPGYSS
jgi:branched-chain amino acid transport system substrate-binding protein